MLYSLSFAKEQTEGPSYNVNLPSHAPTRWPFLGHRSFPISATNNSANYGNLNISTVWRKRDARTGGRGRRERLLRVWYRERNLLRYEIICFDVRNVCVKRLVVQKFQSRTQNEKIFCFDRDRDGKCNRFAEVNEIIAWLIVWARLLTALSLSETCFAAELQIMEIWTII